MRARLLVSMAVLFTLFNFSTPDLSAASAPNALPFRLTNTGQILVPTMINGSGPYDFVLDTGASHSAISDTLAAQLSLPRIAVTEVASSTGSATRSVVGLQNISLGSHGASDVRAAVLTEESIQAVHGRATGIIGQDVLIDAHYTLDYRRKRVIWLAAGTATGSGTRLTLRRRDGRFLVELPQSSRSDGIALFVPDSGASTLVLFQREGRTGIAATALSAVVRATTVTGDSQLKAAIVPKLWIGSDMWWDQPAVLMPRPAVTVERRLDGLLPLSWFSEVTVNGPEHYLVVRR